MLEKVATCMDLYLKEGVFPGYLASFYNGQQFRQIKKGYLTPFSNKQAVLKDNYYDLASLTKIITAILTLKVLEEAKIPFTEKVHDYYPEFLNQEVTFASLLNHTAGLIGFIENRNELKKEALKQALLALAPVYPIGEKAVYSDHHYLILGFFLQSFTKKSLSQLVEEKINQALQTKFTFHPPVAKTVPTKRSYHLETKNYEELIGIVHDPKARIFLGEAGNARLFGRLLDLEKLMLGFCQKSFLSPAILKALITENPAGSGRTLGFKLLFQPGLEDAISHTGYTGGFFIYLPQRNQGMIFLTNRLYCGDYRKEYNQKRDDLMMTYLKEIAKK